MAKLNLHSERKEWSSRSKAWIDFDHVTGIEIVNEPIADPDPEPGDEDFVFDWTLRFKMDGGYEIDHNYYCDYEDARQEAYIYALNCWKER